MSSARPVDEESSEESSWEKYEELLRRFGELTNKIRETAAVVNGMHPGHSTFKGSVEYVKLLQEADAKVMKLEPILQSKEDALERAERSLKEFGDDHRVRSVLEDAKRHATQARREITQAKNEVRGLLVHCTPVHEGRTEARLAALHQERDDVARRIRMLELARMEEGSMDVGAGLGGATPTRGE